MSDLQQQFKLRCAYNKLLRDTSNTRIYNVKQRITKISKLLIKKQSITNIVISIFRQLIFGVIDIPHNAITEQIDNEAFETMRREYLQLLKNNTNIYKNIHDIIYYYNKLHNMCDVFKNNGPINNYSIILSDNVKQTNNTYNTDTLIFGRQVGDIIVDSKNVSRLHCLVLVFPNKYYIVDTVEYNGFVMIIDVGSMNGLSIKSYENDKLIFHSNTSVYHQPMILGLNNPIELIFNAGANCEDYIINMSFMKHTDNHILEQFTYLQCLPIELLYVIFMFMELNELISIGRTCRKYNLIVKDILVNIK